MPGRKKRRPPLDVPSDLIFAITEMFVKGEIHHAGETKEFAAKAAAAWLTDQLRERRPSIPKEDIKVSREQIYPLIQKRGLRFIHLVPPLNYFLERKLREKFSWPLSIKIAMVRRTEMTIDRLGAITADEIIRLIKKVQKETGKEKVHLGLGSGSTTRSVAEHLGRRLETEMDLPTLVVHALSCGWVENPMSAPMTYFSYFAHACKPVEFVTLIAPAVVPWDDFERIKELKGVKESFDQKDDIDIIVTSLATSDDNHGLLKNVLNYDSESEILKLLDGHGWKGDLQYRPYTDEKPLQIRTTMRAISLFELDELVYIVKHQPHRHIIVVCGPCLGCMASKATALLPLLKSPELRVANHLVTDATTAQEVLAIA